MRKILTVIGARPQFIKAAIVSRSLEDSFEEVILHTGQHYDENMSKIFFDELGIHSPKYNLNVGSGSHARQTSEMMVGIEKVIDQEKPDGILIYGDTNSTVAAALVGSKLHIPVFHVEGGIRVGCFDMPEEQNRIVSDHLSSLIFVSTEFNLKQAKDEGLGNRSFLVGDIMYDSLKYYSGLEKSNFKDRIKSLKPIGNKLDITDKFILSTIHRPENTDDKERLFDILDALNTLGTPILFPLHPRIRSAVENNLEEYPSIFFVEPLGYLDTLYFTRNASHVVTDSGGLHKESYLHGTPCTTILRSGWAETTGGNWNVFIRPQRDEIIKAINRENIDLEYKRDQFGNGDASEKIVSLMKRFYESPSMWRY